MRTITDKSIASETCYLNDRQVAELLGVSRASVWRWVGLELLPPPILIGQRTRRWKLADIENMVEGAPANENKK